MESDPSKPDTPDPLSRDKWRSLRESVCGLHELLSYGVWTHDTDSLGFGKDDWEVIEMNFFNRFTIPIKDTS